MSHLGNLISALIDGELDGVELDRANAHLAGCAACQAEAAQLRELKRELRALGDLYCADAVTSRLLAMDGPRRAGTKGSKGAMGTNGTPSAPGSLVTARALERRPGRRARRRRGRYAIWSAMSLVVVGVGAAAFGMGGTPSANEPQITPQLEVFDVQHAITSGDVPFADPAATRATRATRAQGPAQGPAQAVVQGPVSASLMRAAAEAPRP
jgi:anti-sigma factor RsiW